MVLTNIRSIRPAIHSPFGVRRCSPCFSFISVFQPSGLVGLIPQSKVHLADQPSSSFVTILSTTEKAYQHIAHLVHNLQFKMQTGRARGRPGDKLEPAPEPKTSFQFPKMPLAEIQEDMASMSSCNSASGHGNNCDCIITREAFRSPSPDDVKKIADFFIYEIYAKRPEDSAQPSFGCLDSVEYPELYDDAISQFNFLRQCQLMFNDAQCSEFGLRDLHAPDRSRFQWHLSALVNIHKFRMTRLAMIEDAVGSFDDLTEKEGSYIEERSQLEREISAIEQARAKDEPELESVRQVVSELGLKLSSLHKQQIELTDRTRDAKANLAKLTEHAAAVKVKRMTEAEEVDRYRMRVVSSPDRVQSEIKNMAETLSAEKESVADLKQRTQALRVRRKTVEKCDQDVERAIGELDIVLAEQERAQVLQKDIDEKSERLTEGEREIAGIESSKIHLERVVSSIQQKLARIGEQSLDVNRQTSEEDRILAEKENEFERQDAELLRQIDGNLESISNTKKAIATDAAHFRQEVELFSKKQADLHESFGAYHADIQKSQQLISADLTKSIKTFRDVAQVQ